jgi:hypothetical protein
LLLAGPRSRDAVLPIHKVGFIVWLAFTSVHVLGHAAALPRVALDEYAAPAPGRAWRAIALAIALVGGVALAVALVPHFHAWEVAQLLRHRHHHG